MTLYMLVLFMRQQPSKEVCSMGIKKPPSRWRSGGTSQNVVIYFHMRWNVIIYASSNRREVEMHA